MSVPALSARAAETLDALNKLVILCYEREDNRSVCSKIRGIIYLMIRKGLLTGN